MTIDIIYKTVNHKKKMGKVVNYTKYKKSSVPNEANLEGQGWQSRLYHFVDSNLGDEISSR